MSTISRSEKNFKGVEADLIQYAIVGLSIALDRTVLGLITVTSDGNPELCSPPGNTEALLEFFELSSQDVIKALRAQVEQDRAASN